MSLQDLVANIDHLVFDVEVALENQLGSQLLPFKGMDKSGAPICVFYAGGPGCVNGSQCPCRHVFGEKTVVCKHWLRGLCKKGDQCEFLHEYDLTKMPECYFFSKYNACSNKECPFRHIDPESKIRDCPWYDRGFCRHGPSCKNRHRRRVMCPAYLNGFCLDGKICKFTHPCFDIPVTDMMARQKFDSGRFNAHIICHNCHDRGHKATSCPNLPGQSSDQIRFNLVQPGHSTQPNADYSDKKPLQEVTCYKCGEKGHYANKCDKGALAFLSQSAHLAQEIRAKEEQERFGVPAVLKAPGGWRKAGEMMR